MRLHRLVSALLMQARDKGVKLIDEDGLFSLLKASPEPHAPPQQSAASAPAAPGSDAAPIKAASLKGKAAAMPTSAPAVVSSRAGYNLRLLVDSDTCVYVIQQKSYYRGWDTGLCVHSMTVTMEVVCRAELHTATPHKGQSAWFWWAVVGAEAQATENGRPHWEPQHHCHHKRLACELVSFYFSHLMLSHLRHIETALLSISCFTHCDMSSTKHPSCAVHCRDRIHLRGEKVEVKPKGGGKPKDLSKKALMLAGPPGIGKTSSAMIVARWSPSSLHTRLLSSF